MMVKLRTPHVINDVVWPTDTIMSVSTVTPLMIGLDDEAKTAIEAEMIRVYGRWVGLWPHQHLLDNPPLERPLGDNQPVPPVGSSDGPR